MTDTEKFIMRYVDDALSEEEVTELNSLLKEDAEAREFLYSISEQSVMLAGMERSESLSKKEDITEVPNPGKVKIIYALAALLAIAFTVLLFQNGNQNEMIVRVTLVTGSFKWISEDGVIYGNLDVGTELPSGSIEATSDQSSIKLAFQDQTKVTLYGQFSASLSEVRQKKLNLYKGFMSADVNPQPKGKPFLISTPTAQMEVLGTKLNIDSSANNTFLSVSEGAVKLTRKVDAQDVKVKANEAAVASDQASQDLVIKEIQKPIHNWQSDFANTPTESLIGQLIYIDGQAAVKSAPKQFFHKGKQRKAMIHRIGQKMQWRTTAPLILKENSKIIIKGRMDKPERIDLFFLTKEPKGDFAGNFYKQIIPDIDEAGNFEIQTSIKGFNKLQPWSQKHIDGLQIYVFQMYTIEVDPNMIAYSMEILTPEE